MAEPQATALVQKIALNDLKRHVDAQRDPLLRAAARVIDAGWFVHGPELEAFEREFAAYSGISHAIGVGNGTDAIELALRALGIGAGDEVVLAANAGMYSATALQAIGAVPVFADVGVRHLVLDADTVAAVLTPRTRAVIVTHLYGRLAPMDDLRALTRRSGCMLVEDCAQSHGARRHGHHAGSWGDAACFSFYPTKNLGALGDAGLVASGDAAVAQRARQLRQYGWERKYVCVRAHARNSRLDELQAAFLRCLLPLLDGWNAARRRIAARYAAVRHPDIQHPDVEGDDYVAHLYVVRTGRRASLQEHLAARGIASDIHFPLLDCDQPALAGFAPAAALPVSRAAADSVLSLPCYPEMTDAEIDAVCAALAQWVP